MIVTIQIDDKLMDKINEERESAGLTTDQAFTQMAEWWLMDLGRMKSEREELSSDDFIKELLFD